MLHSDRLELRPFDPADAGQFAALHAMENDPVVKEFIDGGDPVTEEDLAGRLRADYLEAGRLAAYRRGREEQAGGSGGDVAGEFLGWFSARPMDQLFEGCRTVELGWRLRRASWGRGYGTEGALLMARHAFTALGAEAVAAQTMTVNAASRRVMEKAGLRYLRMFFADWGEPIPGAEHGDVWYWATRGEWEERTGRM